MNTIMISNFMFTFYKISAIDAIIDDYKMANSLKKQDNSALENKEDED
jgi:hypothetical protein